MELHQYWNVIWKRRWLVLAIVGLTALLSAYIFMTARLTYEAEVRFTTRQEPTQDNGRYMVFTFDRYYNWFGSEFLVDDYTEIVESDAFAKSVLALLENTLTLGRERGALTMNDIKSALEADRKHRQLAIKVTASTREEARAMAEASAMVLTDAKLKPIRGEMVDDRAAFWQIDEATPDEIQSSRSQELLNAALKVAIALVAALALAFFLEYLDTSLRDERDTTRVLEMPVLGTIPRA